MSERDRDRKIERQRGRDSQTDRHIQTDRRRHKERREENTLLRKDKDLSTSRLFSTSAPDDKHATLNTSNKNTINYAGKNDLKTKTKLLSV